MRRFISRLLSDRRRNTTAAAKPPRPGRLRPSLWKLEDRLAPALFTVNALTDDGTGAGTFGDLRYCIAQAELSPGADTINFDPAVVGSTLLMTGTEYVITQDLTIDGPALLGPYAPNFTLDAGGGRRHFNLQLGAAGTFTLNRLSVVNGNPGAASAGAILITNSNMKLNINDSSFSSNTAGNFGGAIASTNAPNGTLATLNIARTQFVSNFNSLNFGGAIGLFSDTAGVINGYQVKISDSIFESNASSANGGAMMVRMFGSTTPANVEVTGTTFSNNITQTGFGGAISLLSGPSTGTATFRNVTFSGNQAPGGANGQGSVLALGNAGSPTVNFINSTLTGNVAANGGAIAQTSGSSAINIQSTIMYGNIASIGKSDFAGGNFFAKNSIIQDTAGGFTFTNQGGVLTGPTADPLLGPLQYNGGPTGMLTHLPGTGSPAREAGLNPTPTVSFDQRGPGFPRVLGLSADIGSIESVDPAPIAQSLPTNVLTSGGATYAFNVTYSDGTAIKFSTIGTGDVTVTGPNTFVAVPTLTGVNTPGDGTPRIATYQFTAPVNGLAGWDPTDNGTYTITMNGGEVDNLVPLSVKAGVLATFNVAIPQSFVVTNNADSGAGSLRAALTAANLSPAADSVVFDGTFAATNPTITLSTPIIVEDSVNIIGPAANKVTVSGGGLIQMFNLSSPGAPIVANISDLTITGGFDANNGGAIINNGETLNLTRVLMTGNTAGVRGGAIFNNGAAATVNASDSTFTLNSAASGGVIGTNSNSQMSFTDSLFQNNAANNGGVVAMNLGSWTAQNSLFQDNIGTVNGGVFFGADVIATIIFRNSTLTENEAPDGGAIYTEHAGGTMQIQNSTIAGNTSTTGGAVHSNGSGGLPGPINISSSIIAQNINGTADVHSTNFGVTYGNSVLGGTAGAGVFTDAGGNATIGSNPLLGPLASNGGKLQTMGLLPGSPAIDKGVSNVGLSSFDQRGSGFPRQVGAAIDMGAFEGVLPVPGGALIPLGPITVAGATPNTLQIKYTDDVGIDFTTIDKNDITITRGMSTITVNSVSVDNMTGIATYSFSVPGGSWAPASNGVWTVALVAGQIKNTNNVSNIASTAGTFNVAVPITYVVDLKSDVDDGIITPGNMTLREAILQANGDANPSLITFSAAVFNAATTITFDAVNLAMEITDSVTIVGPTAPLTYNANAQSRHFTINAGSNKTVDISNLTLTNGLTTAAGEDGAAILMSAETVTLTNMTISGNTTTDGDGGGISISGVGRLNLVNSRVNNNRANGTAGNNAAVGSEGGAINADTSATIELVDSTVSGNSAASDGGGLYFYNGGGLRVVNSTISNNFANNTVAGVGGGGVYFAGTANGTGIFVQNSTISGNRSGTGFANSGYGGGIMLNAFAGTVVIQNSTIVNNTAGNRGGGLAFTHAASTIQSSIVANNVALGTDASEAETGNLFSLGAHAITGANNLIGFNTAFTKVTFDNPTNPLIGTFASPIDPLLGPLASNGGPTQTHAILTGSKAIDAGNNAAALSFDQRGQNRVQGTKADIGAYESAFSAAVPSKVSGNVVINNGAAQRSRVTSLKVNFDNPISFNDISKAFILTRDTGGSPSVGLNTVLDGSGLFVTITFTGGEVDAPPGNQTVRSLVDGKYTFTIVASEVANGFDGGSGVGTNFVLGSTSYVGGVTPTPATGIFRNFGDATGDGFVGPEDFLAFRLAFLTANDTFDYDGINNVDANVDFLQFRLNFLTSV